MARLTKTQAFTFLQSLETIVGTHTEEEKILYTLFEIEMLYFNARLKSEREDKATVAEYYREREDAIHDFLENHGFFKEEGCCHE